MDEKADRNKAMIRRFVEEVKNKRHLEQLGDMFRADYREHNTTVSSFGNGVEGYRNFLNHLFTAFPEDTVTIDEIVAEGDMVVYRGTETGTHKAEFLRIPATGKSATWTEIQFFRIEAGKVIEHWVDVDIFSWFQQLGIIPTMG
ncbi:MAG: ester cyclase [Anaerolineales bacterium]